MLKFIEMFKVSSGELHSKSANNSPSVKERDKDRDSNDLSILTDAEKDEIISTLRICTLKEKTLKEREDEFTTMCFTHGISKADTEAAKQVFLYRDPETWELNILALEKGEWASSMATENFKRWRKVRPIVKSDSMFFRKEDVEAALKSSSEKNDKPTAASPSGARDTIHKKPNGHVDLLSNSLPKLPSHNSSPKTDTAKLKIRERSSSERSKSKTKKEKEEKIDRKRKAKSVQIFSNGS